MNKYLQYGVVIILLSVLFSTCNNTFEPLQEDHSYAFSMYGFLDVYTDTQFVRVMPIGKTLLPLASDEPETTVTLTQLSTLDTWYLDPLKVTFGFQNAYWNYRITEPILPNENYRIEAQNKNGQLSTVEISTPNYIPTPIIEYNTFEESGMITGSYADSIILAGMYYEYVIPGARSDLVENRFVSVLERGVVYDSTYRFRIMNSSYIPRGARVLRREFHIATAGQSWPNMHQLTEEEMTIPTNLNNVTNGTGFVAGIARRIIVITP